MKRSLGIFILLTLLPLWGQGDIIYSEVSYPMYGEPRDQDIDLNSDGIMDFRLGADWMDIGISVSLISYQNNQVITAENGYDLLALNSGSTISPEAAGNGQWIDSAAYFNGYYLDQTYGQFYNTNAFVGIKFEIDGESHYGWLQFDNPNPIYGGYVTGFAYETDPNTSISAGAVPEPGTITLFFIGTIGLYLLRKNKK